MDELEISGKRYISTRRAAREHGYNSDYMGQLIRGKKVKGQKVGRSWYIEEGSLAAYLGKAPVATEPAPAAPEPAPQPVERLVVEEPAPIEPEAAPQEVEQPAALAQESAAILQEEVGDENTEPAVGKESRAIHHTLIQPVAVAPVPVAQTEREQETQEEETRIPIHTPKKEQPHHAPSAAPVSGGLRYAEDDAPSLPRMTRMPQERVYAYAPEQEPAPAARSSVPYAGLAVIGVFALVASFFVSNFITASIVSEEGKSASVQYSIHW
jgi:hypothetical protein